MFRDGGNAAFVVFIIPCHRVDNVLTVVKGLR